jgi:hypothetical protein
MYSTLMSVLTIVGTGIAAFVGSYLKVKGKSLARKEDLDNIVKARYCRSWAAGARAGIEIL